MDELIKKHFSKLNLDIRRKPQGYSRYIDQKITPVLLSFISDCIVNYLSIKSPKSTFTVKDIWNFPYFIKNTIAMFAKPSPKDASAKAEYDKFIAQPLKTLAFAKVLEEKKEAGSNVYTLLNPRVLEYISLNERNAWIFLVLYIEKVLTDSGFINNLENFKYKAKKSTLTIQDLLKLRTDFQKFMLGYTNINKDLEIFRIFPKVLNPYSAFYQIPGIKSGRLTKSRFNFSELTYNRVNFRDVGKDKVISRQESKIKNTMQIQLYRYRVQKAKNIIKRYHKNSEVKDNMSNEEATQVHHIFPESEFPEISDYVENLILLTPNQHNLRAHPKNNTQKIDPDYQKECLLSKIESINEYNKREPFLYSKEKFIHVINIGYKLSLPSTITFEELKKIIYQ